MKKVLKELKERIFSSWITTVSAFLASIFLVIYWNDIDSLLKALGAIGVIIGLLTKETKGKV